MPRSPLIAAVSSSVIYLLLLAVSGQTPPTAPSHPPGGYLPNHYQHAQENTGTPSVDLGRRGRKPGSGHHPLGGHHRLAQPSPPPPPPQGVGLLHQGYANSNNTNSTANVHSQPQGVGGENPNSNNKTNPKPNVPPPPQPPGIGGRNPKFDNYDNHTNPGMLFGWDPEKAKENCGPDCDLDNYILRQEFLIAHNWIRILFNQPLFSWDEKLESAARKYAMERYDDCKMTHSGLPYGENLFWGLKLHWTASDAVFLWYREGQWYDRKSLNCTAPSGHGCGHFTQLVWKDSVRLGCALQHCRDRSKGMLIICEYDPPGNYAGENPFDGQGAN